MRSLRQRGLSLIETIIAGSLSVLILVMVAAWFSLGGRQFRAASQSSFFGRNATLAAHAIRRDLKEAPLLFVRARDEGLSFPSARDSNNQLIRTERGDPAWQGHFFYCIDKGSEPTGKLIRWYQSSPSVNPSLAASPPSPPLGKHQKVIVSGLVRPKASKKSDWPPLPEATSLKPKSGGLEVRFVRSDGTLSPFNPAQVSAGKDLKPKPTGKSTGLVDIKLAILSTGAKGRPNYLEWSFRVRPLR